MARFEVFIPKSGPDGMDMTLRVTADTWMAALKVGLKKLGDKSNLPANVLCDIQDDESIHVTDPRNNKVFRIAQIPEISNPGEGVVLPPPQWMAASSDPPPTGDEELRNAAKIAQERTQQDNAAQARSAQETAAAERASKEKIAADKLAQEKAAAQTEAAKKAAEQKTLAEKATAERIAAETAAAEARAQAETADADARAAKEQKARTAAKTMQEKKTAAERAAQEKALAQKSAAERAAALRIAAERAAQEAIAAEKSAQEKSASEKTAKERAAKEKQSAEEAHAKKLDADKAVSKALREPIPLKVVEVNNQRSPPPAKIGRLEDQGEATQRVEDALAELFDRTPEMFGKPTDEALYFLLDLAMEKVPCESGSFYVADLNRRDLGFAAVRGPKASALLALKLRVPMGKGLVGFCAQEAVAVALSDVQRDKRFFREISERLGYDTKSMITTPVVHDNRTLGAIQLINRSGSSSFSSSELSILHYLAHQAALYLEAKEG